MYAIDSGEVHCRRAVLPACETDYDMSPEATICVSGTFSIKQRDTLDFGIDLTDWLSANGNPQITSAVWAVASDSPKTPVIDSSAHSGSIAAVVITPANNAVPGDAYWLEVALSIGPTVPMNPGDVTIPARTLVRRINVVVVRG